MTAAPSAETVAKLLRKTKKPEAVGVYAHEELQLTVWGWKEGKAGTENKHELPPPIDEVLLFGDTVISAADADGTPQDLTVDDWETFHEEAFKGFEETGSTSEDDAEEEEEEEEVIEEEEIVEEDEEEIDEDGSADEEEEEDEDADEEDEDCYDDGDDAGGGGKRRAPRRRAIAAPEYRRMEMGLRSRVKLPAPPGKRAPRWQTAPELTEEAYTA
jgi:cobalamin biosynthesis protein CobT